MTTPSAPLARVIAFYETLTPQSLATLAEVYAPDARFRDPFNAVQGLGPIRAIFDDMFERTRDPRFVITGHVEQRRSAFLTWDFRFGLGGRRGRQLVVQGCSQLQFDDQGRLSQHRDYWDAANELYAQLPLIGPLMRSLARRLSAQHGR